MPTAKQRDWIVATVRAASDKWPSVEDMPVGGSPPEGSVVTTVAIKGGEQSDYVAALYELCHRGVTPIGRTEDSCEIIGVAPKLSDQ